MKYNNNKEYSLEIPCNNNPLTNTFNAKKMRKFVHRWISSGSHNRGKALICPFCKILERETTSHDNILRCPSSTIQKQERLQITDNLLKQLQTPKQLIELIIRGLSNFCNNHDRKESNQQ